MATTTPRRLGWKVYFGLSCVLTLAGTPLHPRSWLDGLGFVVAVVGLVGLFGYAWSVNLPGPSRAWRVIAVATAVWLVADLVLMFMGANRSGVQRGPVTMAFAAAILLALLGPVIVALYRYADWKRDVA